MVTIEFVDQELGLVGSPASAACVPASTNTSSISDKPPWQPKGEERGRPTTEQVVGLNDLDLRQSSGMATRAHVERPDLQGLQASSGTDLRQLGVSSSLVHWRRPVLGSGRQRHPHRVSARR